MVASSGVPFNISTGVDSNGDSIFNDRPTYAEFQSALAASTIPGNISFSLQSGKRRLGNSYQLRLSPVRFSLNLRLSKTIGFGKKTQNANANAGGPQGVAPLGGVPGGPGGPGGRGGGPGGPGGMFGGERSNQRYSLTFGVSAKHFQ